MIDEIRSIRDRIDEEKERIGRDAFNAKRNEEIAKALEGRSALAFDPVSGKTIEIDY